MPDNHSAYMLVAIGLLVAVPIFVVAVVLELWR